jgi:glutaryl-CoA dehydrogenase
MGMEIRPFPDLYDVEALLAPEERALRDRVREFVDRECLPVIAEHFDRGAFPMHLSPRLAGLGLFGVHVEGYGCRPLSETAYGLVCQELGRCDSGLRAMVSVQNSLVMLPIHRFGDEDQRRRWLPGMAAGEIIGCFGLSEPGYGSDPGGMETRAERDGAGYVLNGRKMWITNGTVAQAAIIWARLEGEIRAFVVESDAPGFAAAPIRRKFAYRTSPTARITLADCRVPAGSLLPGAAGMKSVFQCLNPARYGVACGALGSAIACYQAARSFALERRVFGRAIGAYQMVQEKLAQMLVEITQGQLVNHRLGRLLDAGAARPAQISLAKLNAVADAMNIARLARDILGARGILADHHVMRHLCDLEALSTLEGTASMHTLVLGQEATGISAFA